MDELGKILWNHVDPIYSINGLVRPIIMCFSFIINMYIYICIWRFPEMGVPPNHPFIDGVSSKL